MIHPSGSSLGFRLGLLWLFVGLTVVAWPSHTAAKGPEAGVHTLTAGGLHTVRMETEDASILLQLPEDLVSGESVSGTVTVTPRGETDARRAKAMRRLGKLALDVGGLRLPLETAPVRGASVCGNLRCTSRTETSFPAVPVRLLGRKGEPLAEAWLPLEPTADEPGAGYRYRPVGVTGTPLEILGDFDGDSATTRLELGGRRARILAESPRRSLAAIPESAIGPQIVELREGGPVHSGSFRGLSVALQPGKPALRPGERTTLTLRVLGLDRLDAEMPVQIVSQEPERVLLESGAVQTLHIHPTELQAGGLYQWIGTIQGSGGGPVLVRVSTRHSRPEQRLLPDTPPESPGGP